MDVFRELELMQERINQGDWNAFAAHYISLADAADPSVARRIATIEMEYYEDRLFSAYCEALKEARRTAAKAVYFEYDLDNGWHAWFFVCPEYRRLEEQDDDWACSWASDHQAPSNPEFAEIYGATEKFCETDRATAITLALIARTIISLNSVVERERPGEIVVCIGFHDQDPVHRLSQPNIGVS